MEHEVLKPPATLFVAGHVSCCYTEGDGARENIWLKGKNQHRTRPAGGFCLGFSLERELCLGILMKLLISVSYSDTTSEELSILHSFVPFTQLMLLSSDLLLFSFLTYINLQCGVCDRCPASQTWTTGSRCTSFVWYLHRCVFWDTSGHTVFTHCYY